MKKLFFSAFFALYLFSSVVSQVLMDMVRKEALTERANVLLHYLLIPVIGAGILSFYFIRRIVQEEKGRRTVYFLCNLIYVTSLIGALYADSFVPLTLCNMLVYFSVGHLGGAVYYYLSCVLSGTAYGGRLFTLAYASGLLLQYILQKCLLLEKGLAVVLVATFLLSTYIIVKNPWDFLFENPLPYAKEDETRGKLLKKQLLMLSGTGICYLMCLSLSEISLAAMQLTGKADMYGFPRFFLIFGMLAAGCAIDYGKRRYSLLTFCMLLLGVAVSAFSEESAYLTAVMCAFYFILAFYFAYHIYGFWELAQRTVRPELWAGFGWALSLIAEGAFYPLAVRLQAVLPLRITAQLILLTAALLLLVCLGEFETSVFDKYALEKRLLAPAQRETDMLAFSKRFLLTPRETDVMRELLSSEGTMKELAKSLAVSERVLYRYMKRLHEKTGTETRAGLVKLYYEQGKAASDII